MGRPEEQAAPLPGGEPDPSSLLTTAAEELSRDSKPTCQQTEFLVKISPDGLEASLTLRASPPDPYPFSPEAILQALLSRGVVEGILEGVIQEIVAQGHYVADLVVARGQEPVQGEDGRIEYLFNPSPKPYPTEPDARVDWHDVHLIQTVTTDQPIARRVPARKGTPGVTVTGKPIEPRKVNEARLPLGRGTKADPNDPCQALAAMGGCVSLVGQQVVVEKVLMVPRDVDFSVGNINLEGSVQIGGNVLPGFKVRATGDVHVGGYVEDAIVEGGGSIWVQQAVLGHKTALRAGKDVHSKLATNATIAAGGDIIVQGELVNCRLESGGVVSVGTREGTRNRIVGGHISAATAVYTVALGAESGTATAVVVTQKTVSAYHRLERDTAERIAVLHDERARAKAEISMLLSQRGSGDVRLDRSKEELLAKLNAAASQIEDELEQAEASLAKRKAELAKLGVPRVVVYGTLFPGVHVSIGSAAKAFEEKLTRVQVVANRDDPGISVVPI